LTLYAPAKINLCLRVLGKRPDGYHDIETVFERIALFDRIVLKSLKNGKVKIFCDNPSVPTGKQSLTRRAVELLKKEKDTSKGVEVKIFKKIPIAAGLGGGSSDTASILKGLKKLWRLSISPGRLTELGKSLGSDIPFFLKNCSFASGGGRGDEIKKLKQKKKLWHLIVSPPLKLSSKDIYRSCVHKMGTAPFLNREETMQKGRCPHFHLTNDLEKAVLKKAPLVRKIKKSLAGIGVGHPLVSGSGPSVFSLFEKRKEAIRAKELLIRRFPAAKRSGWQIFTVSTL